jgi:hypothetical protein
LKGAYIDDIAGVSVFHVVHYSLIAVGESRTNKLLFGQSLSREKLNNFSASFKTITTKKRRS